MTNTTLDVIASSSGKTLTKEIAVIVKNKWTGFYNQRCKSNSIVQNNRDRVKIWCPLPLDELGEMPIFVGALNNDDFLSVTITLRLDSFLKCAIQ